MMAEPADGRILRAKYLDWCSAKVADRFLELTPDQIYELAYPRTRSSTGVGEPGGDPAVPDAGVSPASALPTSSHTPGRSPEPFDVLQRLPVQLPHNADAGLLYRSLVERVTEVLAARLRLPSFEAWAEAYRAAPERYEGELLGLWQPRE